jgi:hypothetical protein
LKIIANQVTILFFLCFFSNAYCQTKWKKFNSKPDGYSLLLPSSFELGPRLSGGIIQWFMDSTSNVQLWVEVDNFSGKLDTIFLEHKKNFSFISKEILREKWFVIEGDEGLGALDQTQLNNAKFYEKCILVDKHICILRILYTEYDKSFLDVPKISESFKSIRK